MIQIGRLEGFYWVGKTGGYAAAARAFPYPITQPAVYQQVRKLEDEIEKKLFERVGRGTMRLTPAGRILYDFIEPFFERLPAVVRAIQADAYGGTLRIHASSKVIETILPTWLAAMREDRPDIDVELYEYGEPNEALLRRSETDLVIDYLPGGIPKDMTGQTIAETQAFLVLPSGDPLAQKADLSVADLNQRSFIAYHRHLPQHALQSRGLQRYGIRPRYCAYLDQADAILALVAKGLGFSLVPSFETGGPQRDGVHSVPLNLDEARFAVTAMWRRKGPHNPLIDVLMAYAPNLD